MSAPIIVGVDFSECGRNALKAATKLASDLDTKLVLVHAYPPQRYVPALMGEAGAQIVAEHHAAVSQEEALEFSENYAAWARAEGADVETVAGDGDPVDLLLEEADKHEAGLIVVGTHGHQGFKHFVLGSVAETMVKRSARPVLVVPHKE